MILAIYASRRETTSSSKVIRISHEEYPTIQKKKEEKTTLYKTI